jgi:hypothetical protein
VHLRGNVPLRLEIALAVSLTAVPASEVMQCLADLFSRQQKEMSLGVRLGRSESLPKVQQRLLGDIAGLFVPLDTGEVGDQSPRKPIHSITAVLDEHAGGLRIARTMGP